MYQRRRLGVSIAVLSTCGFLAAACSGSSGSISASSAAGVPQRGGTLTLAGVGDVDFLDPTAGYNTDTHTEERAWTRQLFSYPPSTNAATVDTPVPDVASVIPTAQNGGISDGGLTYTIHLRPDVMWNSTPARPVTAADFVRSFERMCNPVAPVGAPGYFTSTIQGMAAYCQAESKIPGTAAGIANFINWHSISGVSSPNSTTIVFHLLHPTADFLDIIAEPFASAVPIEYLKYVPNSPQFDAHVLSDGPYEISGYKPGVQIVLQRNPVWTASSDPIRKAYVNKIVINEGETPQAVQQQIQAGTVDLGWDVFVPTPDLPTLYGNPNLAINSSAAVLYAVFNEQSPNQNGAMKNVKVRQALEYAINKAAIAQAYGGSKIAQPASQILGPIDTGYQPFNLYPTAGSAGDPQKVKQLLAGSGLPQRDHGEAPLPDHLQQPADRRVDAGRPPGGRGEGADDRGHADRLHGQLHLQPAERSARCVGHRPAVLGAGLVRDQRAVGARADDRREKLRAQLGRLRRLQQPRYRKFRGRRH